MLQHPLLHHLELAVDHTALQNGIVLNGVVVLIVFRKELAVILLIIVNPNLQNLLNRSLNLWIATVEADGAHRRRFAN